METRTSNPTVRRYNHDIGQIVQIHVLQSNGVDDHRYKGSIRSIGSHYNRSNKYIPLDDHLQDDNDGRMVMHKRADGDAYTSGSYSSVTASKDYCSSNHTRQGCIITSTTHVKGLTCICQEKSKTDSYQYRWVSNYWVGVSLGLTQ